MVQTHFFDVTDINLLEFSELCAQTTSLSDYSFAVDVQQNVVIYDGKYLRSLLGSSQNHELKTEIHHCLKEGPGILVIRQAFPNLQVLDRATEVFLQIIVEEKSAVKHRGDHFAKSGENERIWNALQKFCEWDPEGFVSYYENAILSFVSEAWLGPYFQMTSQINIVKPGGQAQKPHRDYHLGFQNETIVAQFPLAMQIASQFLTLQGAVAHTEMSVASGSTLLLPFSQQYPLGYLAWKNSEFRQYFQQHAVQFSLQKGDALFFSPAVFHAAGTNLESKNRIANLLQISSAFGKAMETVDRTKMTKLIYPILLAKKQDHSFQSDKLQVVGACLAEGYSFPTNLDFDPPLAGTAPETMQGLLQRALCQNWSVSRFSQSLDEALQRRFT